MAVSAILVSAERYPFVVAVSLCPWLVKMHGFLQRRKRLYLAAAAAVMRMGLMMVDWAETVCMMDYFDPCSW